MCGAGRDADSRWAPGSRSDQPRSCSARCTPTRADLALDRRLRVPPLGRHSRQGRTQAARAALPRPTLNVTAGSDPRPAVGAPRRPRVEISPYTTNLALDGRLRGPLGRRIQGHVDAVAWHGEMADRCFGTATDP